MDGVGLLCDAATRHQIPTQANFFLYIPTLWFFFKRIVGVQESSELGRSANDAVLAIDCSAAENIGDVACNAVSGDCGFCIGSELHCCDGGFDRLWC